MSLNVGSEGFYVGYRSSHINAKVSRFTAAHLLGISLFFKGTKKIVLF